MHVALPHERLECRSHTQVALCTAAFVAYDACVRRIFVFGLLFDAQRPVADFPCGSPDLADIENCKSPRVLYFDLLSQYVRIHWMALAVSGASVKCSSQLTDRYSSDLRGRKASDAGNPSSILDELQ